MNKGGDYGTFCKDLKIILVPATALILRYHTVARKEIRRIWHNDEWLYSLVDVIGVLTESINPNDYLKKIRKRDEELGFYIGSYYPLF